jgi:hypothetical protein
VEVIETSVITIAVSVGSLVLHICIDYKRL